MSASAIYIDRGDDFLKFGLGLVIWHLAGSSGQMATSTVFEHKFANIGFGGSVKNGLAGGKDGILFLHAPHDVDGNIALRKNSVNLKTVGGKNSFFIAQVEDNKVAVYGAAAQDLFTRLDSMLVVELSAFGDIG